MKTSGSILSGSGGTGGKAAGLEVIENRLKELRSDVELPMDVSVPEYSVIPTEFFTDFVQRNHLEHLAEDDTPDDRIGMAFMDGEMSPRLTGSLWKYISEMHEPVAVRSSSLLEDSLESPLAGIYQTKMIPNNQPSPQSRFTKLMEAIKLVWASTYFQDAVDFHRGLNIPTSSEAMAVILQMIAGRRYGSRFYPMVSGVARSLNYYAFGKSEPEDGVVNLALGLGKTIVDGAPCWTYSPARPGTPPPFGSIGEMMRETQNSFWAVNMGRVTDYDPIRETEYMFSCTLEDADYDDTLKYTASTYIPGSDRLVSGTGRKGPRVLDFAPILKDNIMPLNETLLKLMDCFSGGGETPVEIEFALRGPGRQKEPASLCLLQLRETAAMDSEVSIDDEDRNEERLVLQSRKALGNCRTEFEYAVYVKPESFSASRTSAIAGEIAAVNRELRKKDIGYILIGYGRWGSSDPWLGIPVKWGQISGAGAIVELTGTGMRVELSQGSHFFHNLSSFGIGYLCVSEALDGGIAWDLLNRGSETVSESEHVKCVRIHSGLTVKIDGKQGLGVVVR